MRVQLHSSACRHAAFPIPVIEETVLSPLNGLGILVKNHLTLYSNVDF